MSKIKIEGEWVHTYGGPDFIEIGEDGPVARHWFFVSIDLGGDEDKALTHNMRFEAHWEAEALAEKVRARGVINPKHWWRGTAWDGVKAELKEIKRLSEMGATEGDLEALGLA